jgi:hypothetical protein
VAHRGTPTPHWLLCDVRARVMRTVDALEDGEVQLAVWILFELLDDLEALEERLGWI